MQIVPAKKFPPTTQQVACIDVLLNTTSNIALVARAGCGKTSTILLAVDEYVKKFPSHEVIVCAYNKAIADEVKEKLRLAGHTNWRTISATTIHGLGYGLVKFVFKPKVMTDDLFINDRKVFDLIAAKEMSNGEDREIYVQYGPQINQLVRVAKQAGVGFFNDVPIGDVGTWHALADHFDINGLEETDQMDMIVSCAQTIYRESLAKTDQIDFDDMILFPLIKNLRVKFGKDLIILDEAQDLSRARQALAKKFMRYQTGRMMIVGDDRQAIYGFSGADASALTNMIESLSAVVLPLSVTWRCPKTVVAKANIIVPDIEAAPSAPEGEVLYVHALPDDLKPGDAILCRNTAPLVKLAYKMIRAGKACKVEGRDIGVGMNKLVTRWKIKTIDALIKRIDEYRSREVQKALAKGNDAKAEEVADRCDTILEICTACILKKQTQVSDVSDFIEALFADGAQNVVVLATYHRSKGREWKRVYLWEHSTRCPSKAAKKDWQYRQEMNLAYVAITRAMQSLIFVN